MSNYKMYEHCRVCFGILYTQASQVLGVCAPCGLKNRDTLNMPTPKYGKVKKKEVSEHGDTPEAW